MDAQVREDSQSHEPVLVKEIVDFLLENVNATDRKDLLNYTL